MNFVFSLVFLLACHLGAMFFLYRILDDLVPGYQNLILLFFYATNSYFASVLIWWSAGLHRFPYILLSLACMFYFLQYSKEKKGFYLCISIALFIVALGFYSKAVLIPVYLVCICICQQLISPVENFRRYLLIALGWVVVALFYTAWLLFLRETGQAPVSFDTELIFEAWLLGMSVSAQALLPAAQLLGNNWLVISVWLLVMLITSWRRPKVLIFWMLGVFCVALNVLVIAVSSRIEFFPAITAMVPRYHFEVVFLQVLFLGLILNAISVSANNSAAVEPRKWMKALLVPVLFVYGAGSVDKSLILLEAQSDRYYRPSVFARNLEGELDNYASLESLNLVERNIPRFLTDGLLSSPMPLSTFLALYGRGMPSFDAPDQPLYELTDEGRFILATDTQK